jgi:dihydrofolate reductase
MRKLIYSMGVSLDGFIAGPGGEIDWSAPSEELHRFHNAQAREVGVQLYGRGLYETMRFWETVDESEGEIMAEFAEIWRATPRLVFSTTLDSVTGGATLMKEDPVEAVTRLKQEDGKPLAVGGAGLASTLVKAGLVDEYRLFLTPVIVGGGTRFFPPLDERIGLELVETRTFGSVVYARYARP